jgi:two-component system sensor histidine kinase/response regulator
LPGNLLVQSSLDTRDGIHRIGGKVDAYRKQLRRFRDHYCQGIAELRRLAAEQGAQRAEEYCHALKGVAGTIGAHALYKKVTAIDNQLKQGTLPAAAVFDEADVLLQQVIGEIDSLSASVVATPRPAAAPLGADELRTRLARLEHALEFDLGAVESLLAELRASLAGTPLEAEIAAVAALADVFEIDAARARLKKLEVPSEGATP